MLRREAKLGCEATFSPDLNPCHLDSCLVGGDSEAGLNSPENMEGLECQIWSQLGILSTLLLLPASLVRTKPPTLAKVGSSPRTGGRS